MKVAERITAEMRLYQRIFSASVLFSHLSENREQAAESVIMFLRFCEDEGLTPAGLMEGVASPRSHIAHTQGARAFGVIAGDEQMRGGRDCRQFSALLR